jgi:uncharacterized protein YndB with AHSA1/START domain
MNIKKELTVEAPIERAFRVFTANMGTWWPKEHHIGKSPLADCIIEPRVEGRWYERCEDGSTCDWGKVLVWDPPNRLVLAWQLSHEFRYDPNLLTEVEVKFTALGAKQTRVDFEHRNLERFGAHAEKLGPEMTRGWGMILDQFGQQAALSSAA